MRTLSPVEKIYLARVTLGIVAAFVCIGYLAATDAIPRNLSLNPSVEAGAVTPNNWFQSGNSTEWSTIWARTGSRSLRINVVNATAEWRSAAIIIHEGQVYQIQGIFRGEVKADQFFFTVRWFSDQNGNSFKEETPPIPISAANYSQWTLIGQTLTAPFGAKSCEIILTASNGWGDLYWDDFEIRQAETLTKLFNGTTLALVVYLLSYYFIKFKYRDKVEKSQKLIMTGIGIYFLTWLVFSVLLYTIIAG